MNMAERYRNQLQKGKNNNKPEVVPPVSKPETNIVNIKSLKKLEEDTLSKIQKTPYWKDYTSTTQENMISKYFDSKIKREGTACSGEEKVNFVQKILKIVNS